MRQRQERRPPVRIACARCGKEFLRWVTEIERTGAHYCSAACVNPPFLERFWAAIQRCPHEPYCLYCCWLWHGAQKAGGYGVIAKDGRSQRANRLMWELHNQQSLPPRSLFYVVEHLCSNPQCVNPWHLSYSTQRQNVKTALIADRPGMCRRKLSNEDVRQIRLLRQTGKRLKVLAEQFDVSVTAIKNILYRKTHTYLE